MKNSILLISFVFLLFILPACKKKDSCPNIDLSATITNSDGTNGALAVTATGATGLTFSNNGGTYQASGNFTALAPGTYTITAKNADGCTGSKAFTVAGTKTYYITKATWKFGGATVSGIDISGSLQACQKDNTITFVAGGTGTIDEGATKCNAGDPQTQPFTWSFLSAETQLQISATLFTGGSGTFTIVSISATQMVVSQVVSGQTVVITFIH